jgi:inosine-uridine nucleoside N-ribohydrolase
MDHDRRTFLTRTGMGVLAALAALGLDDNMLAGPSPAQAHAEHRSLSVANKRPTNGPTTLLIDIDTGVDDASALVWLLSQTIYRVDLLGICTVAGNTSLVNATNNLLTVLETVAPEQRIPVVMGAAKPLASELTSVTKLIHGPDGLWGAQKTHNLDRLPKDAPAFYARMAQSRPGFTIVALGPLTNVAQTLQRFPQAKHGIGRIVWLGGAKYGGNHTPVSEFNAWQDPEAAQMVLQSGIPISMTPLDTVTSFAITAKDVQSLERGNLGGRFLVQPLTGLLGAFQRLAGAESANLPDVAAMMVALDPSLAQTQPALVKIVTDQSLARGQTIVALTDFERLALIASDAELSALVDRFFADPSFNLMAAFRAILAREPDNVSWVNTIDAATVRRHFLKSLTK